MAMSSVEIRETYLSYFQEREHLLVPSASLIPSSFDPSVLLTTAGMQPFKPYFLGREDPPRNRICSVQRCFRTTDIEEVGNTARHCTFFEMLGNWSFGDYFKEETIPWGWDLSIEGFGLDPELIWVTVFEGDDELGLGPDEESIEIWRKVGIPDERIVLLPRSENFWQAGPTGPCGPCSEMYLDRGLEFGNEDDRPGGDNDRFVEYWNHVFMSYDLGEDGKVTPLPMRNIDTGMGLERMAAILQGVPSVFETDALEPLVDLAEEMSGSKRDEDFKVTRAMRILADHSRGTAALIADGVVPSNEDRGYVLRRIMRRAIQQGRSIGLEAPFLAKFTARAVEILAPAYPEIAAERQQIDRWANDEEEAFGRTLDRGSQILAEMAEKAKSSNTSWVDAADAFLLHDTYGFPYDLTKELLADEGLSVDDQGFEELMDEQRTRARMGTATAHGSEDHHGRVQDFASVAAPTEFVGYERLGGETSVTAAEADDGRVLVKLEQSPFYAEGGGQVADSGVIRWQGGEARVADVYRLGDDQALSVELATGATLDSGARVEVEVERVTRHATMRNHTATHLLHAALRERFGDHVRQSGSAVRPEKLRFDFTHSQSLSAEDVSAIEERVTDWIKESLPVRALQMSRDAAEELGAMALFGEKYGEWVRVVEVEGVSRELCGGTHVANTSEIGIFTIASESSSAANVRRIEALTGPAAIDWFRERSKEMERATELLGGGEDLVTSASRTLDRLAEYEKQAESASSERAGELADSLADSAEQIGDTPVVIAEAAGNPKELLDLADRIRQKAGDAAVVLGGSDGDKASLAVVFGDSALSAGLSAKDLIGECAGLIGGGGGGRDNAAQAGGKNPAGVQDALSAARAAIEEKLS